MSKLSTPRACTGGEKPGPPTEKEMLMAFVVTEPCVGCKHTDCVTVCPCDCFHEGEKMLYIDPENCIDCEACAAECPEAAIFHEAAVPEKWQHYIGLNAEGAKVCPGITEKKSYT
jgi:ferredoxin